MFNIYSQATAGKRGITVLDRYLLALLLCVVAAWLAEPLRYRRAWDHAGFTTISVLALTATGLLLIPVVLGLRRLWGRPRFQLSSRSILLASLCVAVACGCFVSDRARAERRRVMIDEMQAQMSVTDSWFALASGDWRRRGPPQLFFEPLGKQVYFRRFVTPDEMSRLLAPFDDLEAITLESCSREHLVRLTARHRKLRAFDGSPMAIADSDLELLDHCRSLQFVVLRATKISDAGLLTLAKHSKLRGLNIADTEVTDRGLLSLAAVGRLERIDIRGCKITPEAVAQFQHLKPECDVIYDGFGVNDRVELSIDEWEWAMKQVEK